MGESVRSVGVLDKSVALLGAVESGPCSLTDLVERAGLSRATTHRLAVALEGHGLLRRTADGRFALGVRLIALGRAAEAAVPLAELARPALEELRDRTGESVQLYVRDGDTRVCIAALESPHGLRTIVPLGAVLPLDVGSAGRVLRDPEAAGWVESVGEREAGVASVSAAVRDPGGRVVAAVSASGPVERTTRHPGRRYGEAVSAAAAAVGAAVAGGA